jgi:hypothetical protein
MMPSFFEVSPLDQYNVPDEVSHAERHPGRNGTCRAVLMCGSGRTARSSARRPAWNGCRSTGTLISPRTTSSSWRTSEWLWVGLRATGCGIGVADCELRVDARVSVLMVLQFHEHCADTDGLLGVG